MKYQEVAQDLTIQEYKGIMLITITQISQPP